MLLQDPLSVLVVITVAVVMIWVLPWVRSVPVRWTPSKFLAFGVVVLYCLYFRSLLPALVLLWPLSLICFPAYWGSFRGSIRGPFIDQDSPPVLIAIFGWFFLTVFPVVVTWISGMTFGPP